MTLACDTACDLTLIICCLSASQSTQPAQVAGRLVRRDLAAWSRLNGRLLSKASQSKQLRGLNSTQVAFMPCQPDRKPISNQAVNRVQLCPFQHVSFSSPNLASVTTVLSNILGIPKRPAAARVTQTKGYKKPDLCACVCVRVRVVIRTGIEYNNEDNEGRDHSHKTNCHAAVVGGEQ